MYCILGVPILSRYSQVQFTNNAIMLIPITHGSHQVKSGYIININMTLHTAFKMFVDYIGRTKS